jgi:hypothetical protein
LIRINNIDSNSSKQEQQQQEQQQQHFSIILILLLCRIVSYRIVLYCILQTQTFKDLATHLLFFRFICTLRNRMMELSYESFSLVKAILESNVLQKTKRYVRNRKSPYVLHFIVLHRIAVLLPITFSNFTVSFFNFQSPVTPPAQDKVPHQVLQQAPFYLAAVHVLRPAHAGAPPPAASPAVAPTLL